MDELIKSLKNKIAIRYSDMAIKLQRGYPLENYSHIKEAMEAIDYMELYLIDETTKQNIIDFHLLTLS